ncbi:disulfide bond formation protein B [bacterium]|nr:disulfide bond formation protein B [bacterium]
MWNTHKRLQSIRQWPARHVLRALGVVSLGALLAAYVLQYGFGFAPCAMCLKERIPYAVAGIAALLGSCATAQPGVRRAALAAIALSMWVGVGLAAYHVGIEMGWITESGCVAQSGDTSSLEAMRAAIMAAPLVSCDQPTAVFFGWSLASWNAVFVLVMAFWATAALRGFWNRTDSMNRTFY